jgi:integrase
VKSRSSGVKDVRQLGDEVALHITDEGEGMTVKNKHSVRVVPIHKELRRLGFDTYLDSARKHDVDRLFPELKVNRRGCSRSAAGSWWRKYLKKNGIDGNAYRFRHTFADALREAGGLDAEIGSLLGHSGGSMTEHYGNISQVTMARRSALVNAVIFAGAQILKSRNG